MEVFAEDEPAPPRLRGASIALGNFDGVHRGHQVIVGDALGAARTRGLCAAAAVFEPHPRQVLQPHGPPFRLQSPGQRARALAALGVEIVFELRFDRALAQLSDEEFARAQLRDRLGAAHVSVGADFTFGRNRMGDAQTLAKLGVANGFSVGVCAVLGGGDGPKISSSAIRNAIAEGRMDEAASLLTRPWAIEGLVLPGAARGRTIGFPTANLSLGAYARPRLGVYAAQVDVGDGARRQAVANVGVKPTLGGASEPLLEAHLFDYEGDLYGRRIEVGLIRFLRAERKFPDFAALQRQIAEDAAAAKAILARV
jgi:riboflavin kinase/FMN adenylyltransferase